MVSFVYFNIQALRNSLNNIAQIKKSLDFVNVETFHEDIKILSLVVDCVEQYQEFILTIGINGEVDCESLSMLCSPVLIQTENSIDI